MSASLWELAFERFSGALETTTGRGTAETAPTHVFNDRIVLTPFINYMEPDESRGQKFTKFRQIPARKGAAFAGAGPADSNLIPFWLHMAVVNGISPTQPDAVNGPNTYLWSFVPDVDQDDINSMTAWWGEPNIQYFRSTFAALQEFGLSNDSNSDAEAGYTISGITQFPSKVSAPTIPANIAGGLFAGNQMQLWLDTGSAIGTTELTDRLVSANHNLTTGVVAKYIAAGPDHALDFVDIGIDPTVGRLVTDITLEIPDMTEYDIWAAATVAKLRVRHNSQLIESGGGNDFYRYIEFDNYGVLKFTGWGENVNSNRTATFRVESINDDTLGAPYRVAVQNNRSSL